MSASAPNDDHDSHVAAASTFNQETAAEASQEQQHTKGITKETGKEEQGEEQVEQVDEDWQVQRDGWKQEGDDAFRRGEYETACRHYTQALSLDPTHVVLLSNRSAAYLKANHKSKALADAQACVQHAAGTEFMSKATSRLAAALWSLGRWQAALDAYEQILQLDANNKVAKDGIQQCLQQLELLQQQKQSNNNNELEENKSPSTTSVPQQESGNNDDDEKKGTAKKQDDGDGEDDLLNDFFDEVETTTAKKKEQQLLAEQEALQQQPKSNVIANYKKDLGTAQEQIDRLLQTNYVWRNLNPYWVLDVPHTATEEEISQRYKALSLLLHPDRCRRGDNNIDSSRAQEAYDQVQTAKTVLLTNPDKARHVRQLIEQGMKQGKRDYYHDQQQQQQSLSSSSPALILKSLSEYQSIAVQKILAEVEQKRRDVERRKRDYEQRERQQEDDEKDKEKRTHQFDQEWRQEDRVEHRVGNWRNFATKKNMNHAHPKTTTTTTTTTTPTTANNNKNPVGKKHKSKHDRY